MTGSLEKDVAKHYSAGGLYDRIVQALAENGIGEADMRAEHLKAVDEFHMGGGPATEHLLNPLDLGTSHNVLDIGCGIGGTARHIAQIYGARVTGIDLTPDFVDTARRLSGRLGVDVDFVVGSALDLPFEDGSFDIATLLHVGMNLPDKAALFESVARVLKPGGTFAVYDVMLFGRHPDLPVPWATVAQTSFLAPPATYLDAAERAGFMLVHREDRAEMAREYFAAIQAKMAEHGPPMVGLPLIIGETAPQKVENMVRAVRSGDVAPVEMIFRLAE